MIEEAVLALDVGTSGCRAEIFALDGRSLGRHHVEYPLQAPAPGAAEQVAEDWWRAVVQCTREALLSCRARPRTAPRSPSCHPERSEGPRPGTGLTDQGEVLRCAQDDNVSNASAPQRVASPRPTEETAIRAIGISVQGHSWVPVDEHLTPLRPALTWLDARAGERARRLLDDHPLDFWGGHAGKQPGQWHQLPQLLWLRETEPEVMARARYAMFAHDYLLTRLTGRRVADFSIAAGSLLFDLQTWDWSPQLLAQYQIARQMLPELLPAGTPAGNLTTAAAAELGLTEDVIVAVGAQDQKAAALAAGLEGATATVSLGTSTAITALLKHPRFAPEHGSIPCFPYLQRDQYVLEAPLATAGGALRWLRDVVGQKRQDGYAAMIAQAEGVHPGSDGVLSFPYLAGAASPYWRGDALGGFCGLSLHTGQGHLTRSLLEAVAYDIRANLDHMQALGCGVERLVLFGGGARSGLWPQIIAAVCGVPTFASTEAEAASRGAAMFAAAAIEADPSPFALAAEPVASPPAWSARYEAAYATWAASRDRFWQI